MKKIARCLLLISISSCGIFEVQLSGHIIEGKSPFFIARKTVSRFTVQYTGRTPADAVFSIAHNERPEKALLQSRPGQSFIAAARAKEKVEESRGSFFIHDDVESVCRDQTIDSVEQTRIVTVSGFLKCTNGDQVAYTLKLESIDNEQLRFDIQLANPEYTRLYLGFESTPEERIFGFGEQFTYFDMKGRRLPIFVMEQGIGRGVQPITVGANLTAKAGGDWHTSYAGVPFFMTSRMRSMFLENYEYSEFDMRKDNAIRIEVFSSRMTGRILSGNTPLDLIEIYTRYAGRMQPLPGWTQEGAILGLQGGTKIVRDALIEAKGAHLPIAAVWLQDWVGQRTTNFGKQLWWNWELDRERYPEWEHLISILKEDGIRTMLYVNPFLADISGRITNRQNLFDIAKRNGYLIKKADGSDYLILNTDFSAGLLDLTNPAARVWIKKIINDNIISAGASGWMADFGEALPYDSVLSSGEKASGYHNRYPEEWAQINREAIEESGHAADIVFFSRSGYTRSPGKSTLFWLGDQLVSWDEYDGIKSSVTGLLSGGLSGFSLNHGDIGGYTTINNPLKNYHRSKELFMRWTELSAFTSVFRTHQGNRPEENHQYNSDRETLEHFSRFARVFRALAPYRKELMEEAATRGWPLNRHLFLQYPSDENTYSLRFEEFLLGSEILLAPVLDPGKTSVEVYLPAGKWIHLWSSVEYGDEKSPSRVTIDAPIGRPAVFFKKNSRAGLDFYARLEQEKLLQ